MKSSFYSAKGTIRAAHAAHYHINHICHFICYRTGYYQQASPKNHYKNKNPAFSERTSFQYMGIAFSDSAELLRRNMRWVKVQNRSTFSQYILSLDYSVELCHLIDLMCLLYHKMAFQSSKSTQYTVFVYQFCILHQREEDSFVAICNNAQRGLTAISYQWIILNYS